MRILSAANPNLYMPEIVPAIIAKDFGELKEKIKLVEPYVKAVQLDVMDGIFTPNKTWNEPDDLKEIKTELIFANVDMGLL